MTTKNDSPLRNMRRTRTINQAELARLVGVNQRTISKAEQGIVRLRSDLQERIAAILGASRAELFPDSQPSRHAEQIEAQR